MTGRRSGPRNGPAPHEVRYPDGHLSYRADLAAVDTWLLIDDQVEKLANSKFPRRRGRVAGTKELVAHENYVMILIEDATTVTVLNVVHARRRFP